MKRGLWWLIAVLLVASCTDGEATPPDGGSDGGAGTPVGPTATPLPEDATTAARIRARGYLLAGVRYDLEPFGFVDDYGDVVGFDADLARELALRWLGDERAVLFRQVRSDTAYGHLHGQQIDIALAALPHTQGGESEVDFGLPYFVDGQALLIRGADTDSISGLDQLEFLNIGVVYWSDSEGAIRSSVEYTPTVLSYSRFDEAVQALERGEVDAVADERHRLFWGQRMLPGSIILGQYTESPLAFAIPQNDRFFADLVNLTFQEMVEDGKYAEIHDRWLGPENAPAVERWAGESMPALADAPVTEATPDTISVIEARGRVVVAMIEDRYPFAYIGGAGAPVGYEVRLVGLFAETWLGDSGAVEFVTADAATAVAMVSTGQADVLVGGLAHTRAAELDIDFALTTYLAGESLLVNSDTAVSGIEILEGFTVGAAEGAGSREILLARAAEVGVDIPVATYSTLEEAIEALQSEGLIAVVADRSELLEPADTTAGLELIDWRLSEVPIGLGLPPGDSAFRDLVNLTLQMLATEGSLEGLYGAWFDDEPLELEAWPGTAYRSLRLETPAEPE